MALLSVSDEQVALSVEAPAQTTRLLAEFAASTSFDGIPEEVVHKTKQVLLDCIASAIAATQFEIGRAVLEVGRELGGASDATVWGTNLRAPLATATLVNAELTNALDLDEVLENWGHIAPYVLPPAVAYAEREKRSGRELVRAMAIGYEVAARIGGALTAVVVLRGRPPNLEPTTPTTYGYGFAAFGAAAATGVLLRLGPERMAAAFGIAGHGSQVPGCLKWSSTPPVAMHKYAVGGFIAQSGLIAAMLANRGFKADPTVLDGERGYWRMVGSDFWDSNIVLDSLGQRWAISNTSFKLYSCCRYMHCSMDLVADLVTRHAIKPEEIERIDVRLFSRAAGSSVFGVRQLRDHMDIQFSIPYTIAAAALGLHRGPTLQRAETLADPRLHQLAAKIDIDVDPQVAAVRYERHGLRPVQAMDRLPATVSIRARGRVFEGKAEFAKGDPWSQATRLDDQDLREKFAECAAGVLTTEQQETAVRLLLDLDRQETVDELMKALRTNPPA